MDKKDRKKQKQDRLAQALKENLKRRKAQASTKSKTAVSPFADKEK